MRREADTEVIIIGNGPAGLSMSAFLSGMSPFYDTTHPHPDRSIHKRLQKRAFAPIIEQDLSWYETTIEDNGLIRPVAAFYDCLARPRADTGAEQASCLVWRADPARAVPHVVLGETPIGGSWNTFDPEMRAVSFGGWLDLPGLTISQWLGCLRPSSSRLPASLVASYMRAYASRLRLTDRIRGGTRVTRVQRVPGEEIWRVSGVDESGEAFEMTARHVVLATGKMLNRTLQVENEEECAAAIVYDIPAMKQRLEAMGQRGAPPSASPAVVIVVGDGISAADAVRDCLQKGLRVVHVVRKADRELRAGLMSRLSSSVYPEYNEVFRLMTGRIRHPNYTRRIASTIRRLHPACDGKRAEAEVATAGEVVQEPFDLLVACIGKLSSLDEIMDESYSFGRDYRCEEEPSLFSVGSVAGDHFVRFLIGGCMQVAQSILADYRTPSISAADALVPSDAEIVDIQKIVDLDEFETFLPSNTYEEGDTLPLQVSC